MSDPNVATINSESPEMDDISELFDSNESRLVYLRSTKTGKPLKGWGGEDMGIWVQSIKCDECQAVLSEVRAAAAKIPEGQTMPIDEEREFKMRLMLAATTGFQALVDEGKELKFSAAAARDLYGKSTFIYDLIDKEVNAKAAFTKGAMEQGV